MTFERLLLCLSFAVCLLCNGCHEKVSSGDELSVGFIASLTGAAGQQGLNWSRGAEFAVAEWNQGLRGKFPKVRFIVDDDGTVAARATQIWKRFTSMEGVRGVVGGTWDFLAAPLYPNALEEKIPFVTPTNAEEVMGVDPTENKYVFSTAMTLASEAEVVRQFFVKNKIRRIGLLYPMLPFGTAHADMVKAVARDMSLTIVADVGFVHDSTFPENIRVPASRFASESIDCLFTVLDIAGLDVLTKERSRSKGKYLVLTTQHLDEAWKLSADPPRYVGVYGVYPMVRDLDFAKRFAAQTGYDPKVFTAEGYDAALTLINLIVRPQKEFEFDGVSGRIHVRRGVQVSVVSKNARLVTMQDGELVEPR